LDVPHHTALPRANRDPILIRPSRFCDGFSSAFPSLALGASSET